MLSTFNLNLKKDLYGFYICDELKFHSKLEAIEFSKRVDKPISWNFNEQFYTRSDWTKEPNESLQEMYRKRAEQLRTNYDYLVLFYSSGTDSDNILRTFIDNDIKLDEVVSAVNYEGSKDKLSKMNAEIFEVAIPTIIECQKKQPSLKHRIHDITKGVLNHYEKLDLDSIYKQNILFSTFHTTLKDMRQSVDEWKEMQNAGKRVAFIYGIDKVRVNIDKNKKFFFRFSEPSISGAISSDSIIDNNPWEFVELFYWTPDFPEIPIKQAHIVKNFVRNNGIEKFKKSPTKRGPYILQPPDGAFCLNYENLKGEKFWLTNGELNKLIYPHWYEKPYQYKTISTIFYDKDEWFHSASLNENVRKNWSKMMMKVLEVTDTDIRYNNTIGKYISGKDYYLGV